MCIKAITVRFHLTHPAEKQAWEKLLSMRSDRHQSFSQAVVDVVNAYGDEGLRLFRTEKEELVDEITESVANKLQQMLPAYLAGYTAGASMPVTVGTPAANAAPSQVATVSHKQEFDGGMPDFSDSCMDFDFIGG